MAYDTMKFELDLAGDGGFATDITSLVYVRDDVQIRRGRAEEATTAEPAEATLTINNRSGNFSPRNPVGAYYGQLRRNTPIRISTVQATSVLVITAETGTTPAAGCYVSTPDASALDITGDIDLRFDADLDSWREYMELISKYTQTGNQRSYALVMPGNGVPFISWSADGNPGLTMQATAAVPITTGRLAVRATLDVNNGAGGRTATFYTATDGVNGTWTQLGDPVTASGTTSIFAGTATLNLLDNPNATFGGSIIRGRVYGAQVRNGIGGTVVANPDFTAQTHGATSFTDSAGRTWTLNGTLALSRYDTRFIGEVSNWPTKWDLSQRDIYSPIVAAGVMRRLSQGTSPLHSVMFRAITRANSSTVLAYWPMEDQANATNIASGLANSRPMNFAPGQPPSFAADNTFECSDALLQLNNSSIYGYLPNYLSTQHQVRWLMYIPAGGTTSGAIVCRLTCRGTASRWDLVYGTGGSITLNVYDSSDTLLLTDGPYAFNLDGVPLRWNFQVFTSGSDVGYTITTARAGVALGGIGGTVTGRTVLQISKVTLSAAPTKLMDDVAAGHLVVQNAATSTSEFLNEMLAYVGETAGRRAQRLCREEGVTFQGIGDLDETVAMGAQRPNQLLDLLRECETSDFGIVAESTAALGLMYRTRESVSNRAADATIPYTGGLANLEPVEDDAHLVNDVTVTRVGGSSYRATLDSGALSTQAPPNGVGRYDTTVSVSVETDQDLQHQAGWRRNLGTWDEPRYPTLAVNLRAPVVEATSGLLAALRLLELGDRLVVSGVPLARTGSGEVSELIQGIQETIGPRWHTMVMQCSPELPWRVGIYAATGVTGTSVARYTNSTTTLQTGVNATAGTWLWATASGPLWTTNAARYPLDFMVAGERITVTAMSGTSSPQTATVTRSVNGVVKSQSAGAAIQLYQPARYSL